MLMTLVRQPVDLYARCAAFALEQPLFVDAEPSPLSWYKYEGLRIAKGQGLLNWVADNPNLQAATLMAGVSRPSALPFTTRLHEGRLDRMSVWDPRDAAALRLLLAQFDLVGA